MIKVDITDPAVFRQITVDDLESYMLANGWTEGEIGETSVVWTKLSGQFWRVWLPIDEGVGDYSEAVKRMVVVFSRLLDCSQLHVLYEITADKEKTHYQNLVRLMYGPNMHDDLPT